VRFDRRQRNDRNARDERVKARLHVPLRLD
jgi:hypothetical protein